MTATFSTASSALVMVGSSLSSIISRILSSSSRVPAIFRGGSTRGARRLLLPLTASFLACEAAYFVYMMIEKRRMQRLSVPPPYPDNNTDTVFRVIDRLEDLYPHDAPGAITSYLRSWFKGAPLEDVKLGNLQEFLAWVTFNKTPEILTPEEEANVQELVEKFEEHGLEFQSGYNPTVNIARLTLEPFSFLHRPLFMYALTSAITVVGRTFLAVSGFERRTSSAGVSYWFRPPVLGNKTVNFPHLQNPLVFFHGIAPCGVMFYLPMILSEFLRGGRGAVLVEWCPAVAYGWVRDPATEADVVLTVREATEQNFPPDTKFCVGGHSLGSVPVTWVVRAMPEKCFQLVLLDPITLFLSHSDVCMNFVYEYKGRFKTICEAIIYYAASSEAYTANYLRRHFWWFRNELFLEDVPKNLGIVVSLSLADEIVNSDLVATGLKSLFLTCNLEVVTLEGHTHAEILMHRQTSKFINDVCKKQEVGLKRGGGMKEQHRRESWMDLKKGGGSKGLVIR